MLQGFYTTLRGSTEKYTKASKIKEWIKTPKYDVRYLVMPVNFSPGQKEKIHRFNKIIENGCNPKDKRI